MEAVVFDLDGVIVDSEKHWSEAEIEIYREVTGEDVDPAELSGMSVTNTYQYLSDNYDISISYDEFLGLYEERARELYMSKASLMPGFKKLVKELRDRGLKIGLATGSYWPEYVIERFGLEFDAKSDANLVDGNGKPEPETYRLAVEKLGVDPENAVAVDDTDPGIESAKRAGLYCIGYEGSEGQSLERADETVNSSEELEERLLQLTETEEPFYST